MRDSDLTTLVRSVWASNAEPARSDYVLLAPVGSGYAARSRNGLASLVIPLSAPGSTAIGRRASGCELLGHPALHCTFEDRAWTGPAAALVCHDPELADVFAVLAVDIARRVGDGATWDMVVSVVEEWQSLLTPRGAPGVERETGLWGELWFIERSADVARSLAGWRGPEGDGVDFFSDGIAAEVKTSRNRRHHVVSQAQVTDPVGDREAWFLSLWVKVDPGGVSVASLVDSILSRVDDRAEALRCVARAGYSAVDRAVYSTGFALLSEPEWYTASAVPRVRAVDPGVTNLRYHVDLDVSRRADASTAGRLWRHFHGIESGRNER